MEAPGSLAYDGAMDAIGDERHSDKLRRLVEEQAALRRVATLVAARRPQPEVLGSVTREVGALWQARAVYLVAREGVLDELVVVDYWSDGIEPTVASGSLYHPEPGGATLRFSETGLPPEPASRRPSWAHAT